MKLTTRRTRNTLGLARLGPPLAERAGAANRFPGKHGQKCQAAKADLHRWPRYQPLVLVAAAAALGIVADRVLPLPITIWLAAGFAAWCVWFLNRGGKRNAIGTALLAMSLASLGGGWHHLHWSLFEQHEIGLYARDVPLPVCVEAVAIGSPR